MGYRLVHLSDCDFNSDNKTDLFNKGEQLIYFLKSIANTDDNLVIVVSGNITKSGLKREFKLATEFFQNLRLQLKGYYLLIDMLFVPGENDVNHFFEPYRDKHIKDLQKLIENEENPNHKIIESCLLDQREFRDFQKKNSPFIHKYSMLQKQIRVRNGDKMRAVFYLINSAWMPLKKGINKILMPENFFNLKLYIKKKEYFNIDIIIYHHPKSYFISYNDELLSDRIDKKRAIILTGFQENMEENAEKPSSRTLLHSLGCSFSNEKAGFKLITIDQNGEIIEDEFLWDSLNNGFTEKNKLVIKPNLP